MAEKLKEYNFDQARGGRRAKYDYESLLDGSPWRLKKGSDFDAKPQSFLSSLTQQAKKYKLEGKTIRVKGHVVDEETLVVQAIPLD